MNYEAWNRYVLMAIGLFAVLLYIGLIYAGFLEFISRISKRGKNKKRSAEPNLGCGDCATQTSRSAES